MGVAVEVLTGDEIAVALPRLAALRIAVFRDFPYLYDGDLAYEKRYLDAFSKAAGAIIVVARDGDEIVGASTGAPMAEVEENWSQPWIERGADISGIFYCAESVLLASYRGRGFGHAFFDRREEHARQLSANTVCFCSVVRDQDDLSVPPSYRSNDAFWRKRGYAPQEGVIATCSWKDIGQKSETEKKLQFWSKPL